MNEEKSEALLLADRLLDEASVMDMGRPPVESDTKRRAAAELCRLDDENKLLKQANLDCVAWFDAARRERDELLATLRKIEQRTVDGGSIHKLAHAAITKVEGE